VIIWIDAQLSPLLAPWMSATFQVEARAVNELGMRDATDSEIFAAAGRAGAVVMTKDRDFVDLVERLGAPPQVLWVTCGNTSNARLKSVLSVGVPGAIRLLEQGEPVVEITDEQPRDR